MGIITICVGVVQDSGVEDSVESTPVMAVVEQDVESFVVVHLSAKVACAQDDTGHQVAFVGMVEVVDMTNDPSQTMLLDVGVMP